MAYLDRRIADEDERARTLVRETYAKGYGNSLSPWRHLAQPVAIDRRTETTTEGGSQ